MTETFAVRKRRRDERRELRAAMTFGFGAGWILFAVGAANLFFVVGARDTLWRLVTWLGIALLVTPVIAPLAIVRVAEGVRWFGSRVSGLGFRLVLVVVYTCLVVPVRAIYLVRGRTEPFVEWDRAPASEQRWAPIEDGGGRSRRHLPLVLQPITVVAYMARRGRLLLIPAVIALIIAGLVFFFLQTSAFAPLIYTLF